MKIYNLEFIRFQELYQNKLFLSRVLLAFNDGEDLEM